MLEVGLQCWSSITLSQHDSSSLGIGLKNSWDRLSSSLYLKSPVSFFFQSSLFLCLYFPFLFSQLLFINISTRQLREMICLSFHYFFPLSFFLLFLLLFLVALASIIHSPLWRQRHGGLIKHERERERETVEVWGRCSGAGRWWQRWINLWNALNTDLRFAVWPENSSLLTSDICVCMWGCMCWWKQILNVLIESNQSWSPRAVFTNLLEPQHICHIRKITPNTTKKTKMSQTAYW